MKLLLPASGREERGLEDRGRGRSNKREPGQKGQPGPSFIQDRSLDQTDQCHGSMSPPWRGREDFLLPSPGREERGVSGRGNMLEGAEKGSTRTLDPPSYLLNTLLDLIDTTTRRGASTADALKGREGGGQGEETGQRALKKGIPGVF